MVELKFKYFRDPDNFSFKIEGESNCSICNKVGHWFDAGMYFGSSNIECLCDACLLNGKLKSLGIETNTTFEINDKEAVETILYRTPHLPTWQNLEWPVINGNYCIFEKIASKLDFDNKEDFLGSFSDFDKETSDLEWLWSVLPEIIISNLKEGNYDISIYLFTHNGKKHCIWDAN